MAGGKKEPGLWRYRSTSSKPPSAPIDPPPHGDPLFLPNVPRLRLLFPLPSHYCISPSPLLSLPNAMASCCDAPSGCVWDSVVGWHLAASDKRASELCYSFWDDFLKIRPGRPLGKGFLFNFFFFWRTLYKEVVYNRLRPQNNCFTGRHMCLSVIICSFVIMPSHAAPNFKTALIDFFLWPLSRTSGKLMTHHLMNWHVSKQQPVYTSSRHRKTLAFSRVSLHFVNLTPIFTLFLALFWSPPALTL